MFAPRPGKIDHLFDNLESGKRILNPKSVQTLNKLRNLLRAYAKIKLQQSICAQAKLEFVAFTLLFYLRNTILVR